MSDIKRYTQPVVQQQPGIDFKVAEVPLFEDAKGKYVLASDYDALAQQLALTEAALDWLWAFPSKGCDFPPHIAAILESSRKRINGSDKT